MLTEEEIRALQAGKNNSEFSIKKVRFPSLEALNNKDGVKTSLFHLGDVNIDIIVELGQATLKVREVLSLAEDSIIKLSKVIGESVDVIIDRHYFARGEIVIINDSFGVRIDSINRSQNSRLTEELL
ncbi:MAG: FliM/FliN family flagellar motor switch protein [Eubacteriales bacterium]